MKALKTQKMGRAQSSAEKAVFAFFVGTPRRQPAWNPAEAARRERMETRTESTRRQAVLARVRAALIEDPNLVREIENLLDDPDPQVRSLAGQVIDQADRDQRKFSS